MVYLLTNGFFFCLWWATKFSWAGLTTVWTSLELMIREMSALARTDLSNWKWLFCSPVFLKEPKMVSSAWQAD